jgi:hypothetical protein
MCHPFLVARPKFASFAAEIPNQGAGRAHGHTGPVGEIQPHQYLTSRSRPGLGDFIGAESVDAAKPCLYKGANGGGRNPAAAFL